MQNLILILGLILCVQSLSGCSDTNTQPLDIKRFEIDITKLDSFKDAEKDSFLNNYSKVISLYIQNVYPDTTETTEEKLKAYANSTSFKYFQKDVVAKFSDISEMARTLALEKQNFETLLNLDFPEIFTSVIPYNQSIILDSTAVIVGLNHYMGADYQPYNTFPNYLREFKIPEKIPYDIAEAFLKTKFPYAPSQNTLLERMLYEGAIYLAVKSAVPTFKDNIYLCMANDKFEWCIKNEDKIWNQILIDENLYTTDEKTISGIITPAPFSNPISQVTPGMVGRWLGKEILTKYQSRHDFSIIDFLKNKQYNNSQNILIESEYNGQK